MENGQNRRHPRRRPARPAQNADRAAPRPPQGAQRRPRQPAGRSGRRPSRGSSIRRRSGSVLFRLAVMLVMVAVVPFGVAIFFKVAKIQVSGNSLYREEEIVEASGVQMGDNLITLSKGTIAGRIKAMLPYAETVQVERKLPDTVILRITESEAVYSVAADDGKNWLMSSGGKLLEPADVAASDYPKITGLTAQSPAGGKTVECEQPESLAAAMELMTLLEETDYISQIVEVNVEKPYDIVLWYGAQFEVHLGGTDDLAYKIQYLTTILDDPQVKDGGVIDLTLEEKSVAIFKPWGD